MAFFKKFKRLFKKIFFPAKSRRKSSRKVKKKIPRKTPRRAAASKPGRISAKKSKNPKQPKKNLVKTTTGRPAARVPMKQIAAGRPAPAPPPQAPAIGEITHFFPRIQVCVLKVSAKEIKVGDQILIAGKKSRFIQKVASLQIESINVKFAKRGNLVGLKLDKPAEVGDKVFKMTP